MPVSIFFPATGKSALMFWGRNRFPQGLSRLPTLFLKYMLVFSPKIEYNVTISFYAHLYRIAKKGMVPHEIFHR